MRIAYIGPAWGTSLHRARALERLGHEVRIIDPWRWLGRSKWVARWLYHLGGVGVGLRIDSPIEAAVRAVRPELVFVNQGESLGSTLIRRVRALQVPIANYTNDDPFHGREGRRFQRYLKALPYYDLVAVVREQNVGEARAHGARNVLRVWMSADEVAHAVCPLTPQQRARYASEVAFIGTWMPERGPLMTELIHRGVPIAIWGDRWQKAGEWSELKPYWRGSGLYNDDDYAAAIRCSKVSLGLLSKGNRDLHTTRSAEIPALGGVLCAERTSEHQALYEEGTEAAFWSSAEECAAICHELLADDERRRAIARRGHERALRNNLFNEPVMAAILERAMQVSREQS